MSWTEQTALTDNWSNSSDKTDGWSEYGALTDLWNAFEPSMAGSVSASSSVSAGSLSLTDLIRKLYSDKVIARSRVLKSYIVKTAVLAGDSSAQSSLSGAMVESVLLASSASSGVSTAGAFQITTRELKSSVSSQSNVSVNHLYATLALVSDKCDSGLSTISRLRVTSELFENLRSNKIASQSSALAVEMRSSRTFTANSSAESGASAVELKTTGSFTGSVSSQSGASAIELESGYSLSGDLASQSSALAKMNATRLLVSDKISAQSGEDAYLTVTESNPQELKSSTNAQSSASGSFALLLTFIGDSTGGSNVSGYLQHVGEVLKDSESDTLLDSEGRIIRTPE